MLNFSIFWSWFDGNSNVYMALFILFYEGRVTAGLHSIPNKRLDLYMHPIDRSMLAILHFVHNLERTVQ